MHRSSGLSPEQKEQAQHGERLFPLKKYITTLSSAFPRVPAHWHDEAELTMITKGNCTYQIHLDTYEAEAGDLLFVPPAVLHGVLVRPGSAMTSDTFVFHMSFLGADSADICAVRYLVPVMSRKTILPCLIKKDHPAYRILLSIFHQMDLVYDTQGPGYELLLKGLLLQAVSALLPYAKEAPSAARAETESTQKLKHVLEYIGEHYSEELSISRLAQLCYFSEYHFMRFFKKYAGVSCMEYIKNLRLEKAAERFMYSDCSVLDSALSCGFSNLSYFYREFKKKYGMTPKKFIETASSDPVFEKMVHDNLTRP